MKAIILAAGLGTRLRPLTDNYPKCMVEVNGIKIIDRQISNLTANGINEIYAVTGYKSEILCEHINHTWPHVHIIHNTEYDRTNNMYSLFMSREYVDAEDFLLMNGDVYFDGSIIRGLLDSHEPDMIACDKSQYILESMKVIYDGQRITHISKEISQKDYYAVSIDIYKISAKTSRILFSEIEEILKSDKNSWTEKALDRIFPNADFQPYIISGRWFEIDNHEDLSNASEIFRGDSL